MLIGSSHQGKSRATSGLGPRRKKAQAGINPEKRNNGDDIAKKVRFNLTSSPFHSEQSWEESPMTFDDVYGKNNGGPPQRPSRRSSIVYRFGKDVGGARRSFISACRAVMENPNFDRFILTVILINTIDMAIQDPTIAKETRVLERIFLAIFLCEMVSNCSDYLS